MGVTKTKKVEIVIVVGNLLALLVLGVLGLANWNITQLSAGMEPRDWWSAPIGAASIFIAYEGFQLLTYEYDQIRKPAKILKPAILTAVAFVVLIYILVTLGATMLAGALSLIDQKQISLSIAARAALGTPGLIGMTVAAVFATAAAINSTLFSTANLSKRVAGDGELPRFFEHTNTNNIPDRSVILIGVCAAALAIIGKLSTLVEAASLVFIFTFGAVNVIAVGYVRKKQRWLPWGGAILATLVGVLLMARLLVTSPIPLAILVLLGLVIIIGRPAILKNVTTNAKN